MSDKKRRKRSPSAPGSVGRPRTFKTKKALSDAIDRYFNSISRTVTATDDSGREILSDDMTPITYTQYVVPPSVIALSLYLGIDRSTWQNYCNRELHPEFSEITSRASAKMEAYLAEESVTRQKGSLQGIIFNLQNNYGWRSPKDGGKTVSVDGREGKTDGNTAPLTLGEKMEFIKTVFGDFPDIHAAGEGKNEGEGDAGSEKSE